MPKNFDPDKYSELLRESKIAFLQDSAYAIAVAKPAGTFAAKQREKEKDGETPDSAV